MNQIGFTVPVLADDEIAEIERAAGLDNIRSALGAELEKLNNDQRHALQLRIVDELPYQEVARQLGVTETTARASRLARTARAGRDTLEPTLAHERSTS